jgi:hypothetical protein
MRTIKVDRTSCRLTGREFIGNVVGTSAFSAAQRFQINPGQSATFPKLSVQAQVWQTYRFSKLKFCYYTRTGSATAGSVMLTPDYDPSDSAPANEMIASSYLDAVEDGVWKNIECDLDVASMFSIGPKKFVRTGALPGGEDIKAYDAGNLFVCTVDGVNATPWGKIWVEYDVTFFTPQLPPAGATGSPLFLHLTGSATSTEAVHSQVVVSGTAGLANMSNFVLEFLYAGTYLVNYNMSGGATTAATTFVAANGAALVASYGTAGQFGVAVSGGSGFVASSVLVTSPIGGTLTFTNDAVGTNSELFIASALNAL